MALTPERWGLRGTLAVGLMGAAALALAAGAVAQVTWSVGPHYALWLQAAGTLMLATGFWSASWIWLAFTLAERRVMQGMSLPRGILAFAAQCAAALAFALAIGHLLHPLLHAWYAHAFGPLPAAEWRLLPERNPDGSDVLELYGPLGLGTTARLQAALAAHTGVRTVQIDSAGGLAPEALGVARLIEAHGLDTAVERRCEGVCVVVLAAGARRLATPQAVLRCHKPYMPILGGAATLTAADQRLRQWLVDRGVDPALALACHQRPAWQPLTPDPATLKDAWLVTDWKPAAQASQR